MEMFARCLPVLLVIAVVGTVLLGPAATPAAADRNHTGEIIAGMIIGGLIGAALADDDRGPRRCGPPPGDPYRRYDPPRCGQWTPPGRAYDQGYHDGWYDGRDVGRHEGYSRGYSNGYGDGRHDQYRADRGYAYGRWSGGPCWR